MTRVKICGIRDYEELRIAVRYADAVGFVTEYPIDVPWNISREKAKELISKTPPFIYTVVVTSGEVEKIIEIAETTKPDGLQLHGQESLEDVRYIKENVGTKVIKAIQIDVKSGKAYEKSPVEVALLYEKAGVDAILLDSKTEMPAGTGKTFNWEIARKVKEVINVPLILAGGLNSGNVRKAIEIVNPFAVDVISGVETEGKKDERKVREFVRAVKMVVW